MLWAVKDGNAYYDEFEIWPSHCEAQVVKTCLFHHFRYTEKVGVWWWGQCLHCPVTSRKHESFFWVNEAMIRMEMSADTEAFLSRRTASRTPSSEASPNPTEKAGASLHSTSAPAPPLEIE